MDPWADIRKERVGCYEREGNSCSGLAVYEVLRVYLRALLWSQGNPAFQFYPLRQEPTGEM